MKVVVYLISFNKNNVVYPVIVLRWNDSHIKLKMLWNNTSFILKTGDNNTADLNEI